MEDYTPRWSLPSVAKTEALAKQVHRALSEGLHAPLEVRPTGSFLMRTSVLACPRSHSHHQADAAACQAVFDMSVTIPTDLCSLDDIQEGRYVQKRLQFLLKLKKLLSAVDTQESILSGSKLDKDSHALKVSLVRWRGEDHREVLQVEWGQKKAPTGATQQVDAAEEDTEGLTLPPSAGEPEQETETAEFVTLGTLWLLPRPHTAPAQVSSAKAMKKHSLYCSMLVEDYLMPEVFELTHKHITNCPPLAEAIVIVKAWAVHVGLATGSKGPGFAESDAVHGATVTAMMIQLLEEDIISATMSAENMVRAFWVQLSRNHYTLSGAGPKEKSLFLAFNEHHLNFLWRNTLSFFEDEVKAAAETALRLSGCLDIFSHRGYVPPHLRYDSVLCFEHLPKKDSAGTAFGMQLSSARVDWSRKLTTVVRTALRDRVTAVFADYDPVLGAAFVGVNVTKESEGRSRLIRGPPIEHKEDVEKFNAFWPAGLTSTRQFADGGVFRCVVWEEDRAKGRPTTVSSAISEILAIAVAKHFGEACSVCTPGEDALMPTLQERIAGRWIDASTVATQPLKTAVDSLTLLFQHIGQNALPCEITDFSVVSEVGRETAIFPSREHYALLRSSEIHGNDSLLERLDVSPRIEPIYCVATIDDKGKIPNNTDAISKMKQALLVQLSKVLTDRNKAQLKKKGKGDDSGSSSTYHPMECFVTRQSLDVAYCGFLFRIFLGHYREVSLLKTLERTAEAMILERKLFHAVQHATFIRTVIKGHPSSAHAMRLATRWVSAMMLSDYVLPEVCELLVAYIYQTRAQNAPKTPGAAFYSFLQLLALFPWSTHPLVFPFVEEDAVAIRTKHEAQLDKANRGMMWIATPYAPTETPYTLQTPRPAILAYLVSTARSVLASCTQLLAHPTVSERGYAGWADVWRVSAASFDIVANFSVQLPLAWDRCVSVVEPTPPAATAPHSNGGEPLVRLPDVIQCTKLLALDEHSSDSHRTSYVSRMVEFEPAQHCVRSIRAKCRDVSMVLYDAAGPSTLGLILLAPRPKAAKLLEVRNSVEEIAAGALTDIALTKPTTDSEPQQSTKAGKKSGNAKKGNRKTARSDRGQQRESRTTAAEKKAVQPKQKKQRLEAPSKPTARPAPTSSDKQKVTNSQKAHSKKSSAKAAATAHRGAKKAMSTGGGVKKEKKALRKPKQRMEA